MQADFASGYEFEMFDRIGDIDLVAVDAGFFQSAASGVDLTFATHLVANS